MFYQVISYIKFLKKSTNQHGVHSPFVYQLLTACVYKKHPLPLPLKRYRTAVHRDHSTIDINDFGSGSRVFKSNTRKVSAIAKHAGISKKRQVLLFKLTHYFQASEMLELGTSLGLATVALSLGNANGKITTIEGCANTAAKTKSLFTKFSLDNITLINNNFDDYFTSLKTSTKFDIIYIDGNHNKEDTIAYFKKVLPLTHNESLVIFDDIYWSPSMTKAWKEIIKHQQVTVSIDSFYWGMVFFRREQKKQHFTLRL